MTTTAHEDQYLAAPEPVREPLSREAILKRNIADLEVELKQQTERAESYAETLRSIASYVGAGGYNADTVDAGVFEDRIRWGIRAIQGPLIAAIERAEKTEAELAKLRELPNVPIDAEAFEIHRMNRLIAADPKMNAPSSLTDEQIHAAYRNALGQSIRERDMPEIRKFARALLQSTEVKS